MHDAADEGGDAERVARHAERPGFRISELRMSPTQRVPWHCHTSVQDTFYVLEGSVRITLRDPDDQVELQAAKAGDRSARDVRIWSRTAVSGPRHSWCFRGWVTGILYH
jgi:hypothetical protein